MQEAFKKLRVGIDLDGVGYVFGESVRDYLRKVGINVPEATDEFCTHWDFYEFWGMTREEFGEHCDAGVDSGIIFGPGDHLTRPNFFDAIRSIKAMGHDIVVATHRHQGKKRYAAQENTFKWLAPVRHLIDEIHFTPTSDKTIYNTDMFVEDSKPNYDALIEAGQDAWLISRPWNGPYDDDRKRISDIKDFVEKVRARTNQATVV